MMHVPHMHTHLYLVALLRTTVLHLSLPCTVCSAVHPLRNPLPTVVTACRPDRSTVDNAVQLLRNHLPIVVTDCKPERSTVDNAILNLKNVIHPRKKKNQQKGRMAPRCAREWLDPIC